jgi:hypothetical protein
MKMFSLIGLFCSFCVVAFGIWLPAPPTETISRAVVFADQLDHAKRIDRDATYLIQNLIASLREIGPQADSVWETRRLSAIARLQSDVIAAGRSPALEAKALPPK